MLYAFYIRKKNILDNSSGIDYSLKCRRPPLFGQYDLYNESNVEYDTRYTWTAKKQKQNIYKINNRVHTWLEYMVFWWGQTFNSRY